MIVHNWTRVFHEDLVKERNHSFIQRTFHTAELRWSNTAVERYDETTHTAVPQMKSVTGRQRALRPTLGAKTAKNSWNVKRSAQSPVSKDDRQIFLYCPLASRIGPRACCLPPQARDNLSTAAAEAAVWSSGSGCREANAVKINAAH